MRYPCRECGHEISSAATSCPYCGAPPTPPLHVKPWYLRWEHRLFVLFVLLLPVLMMPVIVGWYYDSFDPCEWLRRVQAPAGVPADLSTWSGRQCLGAWLDAVLEG